MNAIVEVRGLRKVYASGTGEVVAVDDLDLTVGLPGTVHGFLGPNGSGKTTTIRCLLRLIRPTAGELRLFGVDTATDLHTVVARVGAIVEGPKLFPPFSARKNLEILASMGGLPKTEVDRVLEVVGLSDRDRDSFESYSMGMKQRLAIAAALLRDPDLLILDEPANGLDPAGIAEIRRLIRSFAEQGKAVLISSHQLPEIEQVCDEVTIIDRGRVVVSGALDEVRRHAGPDLVVATIANRDGAISVLEAAGIGARPRPHPEELVADVSGDRAAEITRRLADEGLYLHGLRVERATLEAAFLNLTGGPPPPPAGSVPVDLGEVAPS